MRSAKMTHASRIASARAQSLQGTRYSGVLASLYRRAGTYSGVLSLLGAFLLGTSACSSAQLPSLPSQTEQSAGTEVAAAYNAYLRAWRNKDLEALNRLLSDDYEAVNFKGIVSTKANEIAAAKEDQRYETMDGHVRSVRVFGDSAVASGLIVAAWKDDKGAPQKIAVRFLAMLQKQQGEWKLVATQSTRFNAP